MKLEKDDGEGEPSLDLAVVSNFGHGFGAINYVVDLFRGKCLCAGHLYCTISVKNQ